MYSALIRPLPKKFSRSLEFSDTFFYDHADIASKISAGTEITNRGSHFDSNAAVMYLPSDTNGQALPSSNRGPLAPYIDNLKSQQLYSNSILTSVPLHRNQYDPGIVQETSRRVGGAMTGALAPPRLISRSVGKGGASASTMLTDDNTYVSSDSSQQIYSSHMFKGPPSLYEL